MPSRRAVFTLAFIWLTLRGLYPGDLRAQADAESAPLIKAALTALQSASVRDVKLTLTARSIAGSKDETMPATFVAMSSGSTQLIYQAPEGPITETRVWSQGGGRSGSWTDSKGASHVIPYHNMAAEGAWFFPGLSLARVAADTLSVTYVGPETFNGVAVQHLRLNEVLPSQATSNALLQAVNQTELYLDAATLRPVGMMFNEHPDTNLGIDIPIRVIFSQYQVMNGLLLPTRIEQYRNNSLALDITVQSIEINTGITLSLPPV